MIGMDITPPNEKERLENLKKYKIWYTKSEPIFDQLAAITAQMLNMPIAVINFVDKFKAWTLTDQKVEMNTEEDQEQNLCSMAVLNENVAIYKDVAEDLHLISNPLVAGEHGLKFYAATPITTNEGFNVGTVCVVDKKLRTFSLIEQRKLEWVASMVRSEMNKRIAVYAFA